MNRFFREGSELIHVWRRARKLLCGNRYVRTDEAKGDRTTSFGNGDESDTAELVNRGEKKKAATTIFENAF